ncbi:MAG: hypothetical protein CL863_06690 [Cyanobium sp. RS427]|nr:hypothetical protein [Cyanobium sp. RS427]
MPRFRCPTCCCGPAIVLRPPRGVTPICPRCRTPLQKQPLVRPIGLLVLISVGSVLLLSSFPAVDPIRPPSSRPHQSFS